MATAATRADALVHARSLTRRFANLTAVDAIDFGVERGEAFGFLGPNGAGKTSRDDVELLSGGVKRRLTIARPRQRARGCSSTSPGSLQAVVQLTPL